MLRLSRPRHARTRLAGSTRRRNRVGFTLIEVLLVVAILIILAALAVVNVRQAYINARKNAARLDIKTISQTIDAYYLDLGSYPPTLEALVTMPDGLANSSKWSGPYLKDGLPADPWGNAYKYSADGTSFVIASAGPNGVEQDDDDISSQDAAK